MKKICIVALLTMTLFMLSGCSSNIIHNSSKLLVTETHDASGSLVQRSEINRESGLTTSYLYTYAYDRDYDVRYCTNIRVVTIDRDGHIIESSNW